MTAVQELEADPVGFIRHYLLKIANSCNDPPPQAYQADGTILLTLEDVTNIYGGVQRDRNRKGVYALNNWIQGTTQSKATRIYRVRPAVATDAESFAAYICPYRTDASLSKQLGNAASLMFTAEMSGCSFGIGIQSKAGVLVMHSNEARLATQDSTDPQVQGQLQALQTGNASARMLQPGMYRHVDDDGMDTRSTTLGIRVGGKWEFWYQNFNFGVGNGDKIIRVSKIR